MQDTPATASDTKHQAAEQYTWPPRPNATHICEQCECECAAELHFDPSDEGWYCEECFVEEYGSAWRDFVGVLPAVAAGVQLGGRGRSGQGGGVAAGENGGGGGGGGEG